MLAASNKTRGASTLEIIIAFAVLTLTLSAACMVVFGNQELLADAHTSSEALAKAQDMQEDARALAQNNFDAIVGSSTVDGIYTKTLDVVDNGDSKKVTSSVSWHSGARTLSMNLTSLLSNPANDTCGTPTGNWKSPVHYDFPTTSLMPGGAGLGIADVAVAAQKLYVAAYSSAGGNTLNIFDLPHDPSAPPAYAGGLDNIPSIASAGLNSIAVAGTYVFGANGYAGANFTTCVAGTPRCGQLQTFAVRDPAHPTIVANTKVPGIAGVGGQGAGETIRYKNGYVYLGLAKTASGPEFNIFDVGAKSGSPANPIWEGGYTVGRTINSIRVIGNYAYLATDDPTRDLVMLDVSDKTHPTLVGTFDAPGIGFGYTIYAIRDAMYLGLSYAGGAAPEFYILHRSAPPGMLGSQDIGTAANPDGVDALLVRKNLAFLLTNKQLQIWDVSDPTNIIANSPGATSSFLSLASMGSTGVPASKRGALVCAGNLLYAAVQSAASNSDGISIVTAP